MTLKLSRIIINKFIRLKYADLAFNKFTSINGKNKSVAALTNLAEAINFILDCSDLAPESLLYSCNEENEDDSNTFVEAHVVCPSGVIKVFKRTIVGVTVLCEIDGRVTTKENYKKELVVSGIILPSTNTLVVSSASVHKVATLSEHSRGAFIEIFCDSKDLISAYDQFSTMISHLRVEIDATVQEQKELTVEKKKMKIDIESSEKRSQMVLERKSLALEFDLFKMYHNKTFADSAFDEVAKLESELQELKVRKAENFEFVKKSKEMETSLLHDKETLKIQLDKLTEDYQLSERDFQKADANHKVTTTSNIQIQESIDAFQNKIKTNELQISKLESLAEGSEETHQDFLKLRTEFEEENFMDLRCISSIEKIVREDDIKHLTKKIKNCQEAATVSQDKIHSINENIAKLKAECEEKSAKKRDIEISMSHHQDAITSFEALEELYNKTIEERDKKFLKTSRQKIIKELKEKFPKRVIGRLSELWTSVANTVSSDEYFINNRLGKFSEAIVVDDRKTADECISFLKFKFLIPIDETFLPLSDLAHQKASKALLPNEKLPANIPGQVIEDLLKATNDEVEKVLVYCLQPAIVLDSLKDAEKCLSWKGSKKLNVISTETANCFNKNGFLERDAQADVLMTEEDLIKSEEILSRGREKLIRQNTNKELKATELVCLNLRISLIYSNVHGLEASLASQQQIGVNIKQKMQKLQADLNKLMLDKTRLEQQELLDQLRERMKLKEIKHYQAFCEALQIQNIQEYLKQRKMPSSMIKKNIELMKQEIEHLNREIADNESMKEKLGPQVTRSQEELIDKMKIIHNLVNENCNKEREYLNLKLKLHEEEETREAIICEIVDVNEKIIDNLNRVQMSFKDNYNILTQNFMAHTKLPLSVGTLSGFVFPPDEIPVDYSVVCDQLKSIEVDFQILKDSLKENVDVAEKTLEFSQKLENLDKNINKTTKKIGSDINQQRVKRITEGLRSIEKKLNDQKKKFDEINETLHGVKAERKRIFEDTFKHLNESIDEFSKLAYDKNVLGMMEIVNEAEPYLGDIIYYWRTIENPENRVTEIKPDYISSLALLFAILKLKQQKFVVLNEAAKSVNVALEKFFQRQNYVQVISLTSQMSDDHSNYIILPKSQSFTVTKLN